MLTPSRRPWLVHTLAAALLLASALLHLAYLSRDCPLDLAPDEAHYWDWSRRLDWSYYSKGPLVAWLIRGSCELFGPLASRSTGSEMPAVRLPAVLSGTLLLLALYVLTYQVYRRERLALGVLVLALTLPPMAAASSLMTIDAPYTCCWAWALVTAYQAVFRGSRWAWPATGVLVGVGILAKYTMVLFLPSLALFLLTCPQYRPLLRRPGFWVMSLTAGLSCLPILVWNIQNDWVTLRHVNSLAGTGQRSTLHWSGPLIYLGGQCLLLLGFWFVAWAAALWENRPWRQSDPGVRYLWWLSLPMFLNFLVFSVKNGGGELNWPVAAYLSGVVLLAPWLAQRLESPRPWRRRLMWGQVFAVGLFGLLLAVAMHHSQWLYPVLDDVLGPPTVKHPLPMRRVDPTCRLRGWRTLAGQVDRLRVETRTIGRGEAIVAGTTWSIPGELGFYCEGRPPVYSVGRALGDRHSQYDLWHPNPVADPEAFRGRTFIIVGPVGPAYLAPAFERVEEPIMVTHEEDGRPLARWQVTVAHGFRGFPPPQTPSRY